MAKSLVSTPPVSGPLNRGNIDRVTHQDHDHLDLWNTTNATFAQHTAQIASLQELVTTLQAQVKALQG